MKQTAVEWLVEELNKSIGLTNFVDTCDEEYKQEILGIIHQAKAMEKEQIIDAVVNTVKIGTEKENVLLFTSEDEILIRNEAEQYYNETFKSE